MTTLELRKNFHLLIDSIENENLLADCYDLIKNRSSSKEGQLWNKLTYQEQEELISALGDTETPELLISNDEMKKKHIQWL
jgi:hypothetical protein